MEKKKLLKITAGIGTAILFITTVKRGEKILRLKGENENLKTLNLGLTKEIQKLAYQLGKKTNK